MCSIARAPAGGTRSCPCPKCSTDRPAESGLARDPGQDGARVGDDRPVRQLERRQLRVSGRLAQLFPRALAEERDWIGRRSPSRTRFPRHGVPPAPGDTDASAGPHHRRGTRTASAFRPSCVLLQLTLAVDEEGDRLVKPGSRRRLLNPVDGRTPKNLIARSQNRVHAALRWACAASSRAPGLCRVGGPHRPTLSLVAIRRHVTDAVPQAVDTRMLNKASGSLVPAHEHLLSWGMLLSGAHSLG
jgi:hypothetical protein